MSITSVKSGLTSMSLALDNNFMEPIATTLVGSGGSTVIEFLDIPQNYKHLQIRFIARTNRGLTVDYFKMQFNGDTGTNYSHHSLGGNGVSATSDATVSASWISAVRAAGANASANIFGVGIIDILDYTNTNKFKVTRNLGGDDNNGDGDLYLLSGLWQSMSPITTIRLAVGGGTLINQHSRFSLYGVKG